jgi:hypothetical protein
VVKLKAYLSSSYGAAGSRGVVVENTRPDSDSLGQIQALYMNTEPVDSIVHISPLSRLKTLILNHHIVSIWALNGSLVTGGHREEVITE